MTVTIPFWFALVLAVVLIVNAGVQAIAAFNTAELIRLYSAKLDAQEGA